MEIKALQAEKIETDILPSIETSQEQAVLHEASLI